VRTRAPRAVAPAGLQRLNGHEDQKQAPARTVTTLGQPDSLRLVPLKCQIDREFMD
jgi:hypothetical protein